MKTPKPPPAPSPEATAAAQAHYNKETAVAQTGLNSTNQVTPYGNLTYSEIGKWSDGTPRFQATTTLSPEQQHLLNQEQAFDRKFNDIALAQTDKIGAHLSKPLDLNNEAVESRLMELGRKRLDPVFAERKAALEADLQARGIGMGTEAYDREFRKLGETNNDAITQLLLQGRGQAVQEALTERNAPINEISALMNGGQITQPNFINTPQSAIAPTDYMGAVQMKHASDMAGWQAKVQNKNAMMSGLFGLGKAALGGWAGGGF